MTATAGLFLALAAAPASGASLPPHYVEITREAGITFTHVNGGTVPIVIYEQIAPGAAMTDYDGDGDLDLFLVQSGHRRYPLPPGAAPETHRLYRNDGPDPRGIPRYVDRTAAAGIRHTGYGMGVVGADADNDGDEDLYVTHYGPNVLYLNRGDGTFEDVASLAGVDDPRMSLSAAFGDADGDGLPDLYVTDYVDYDAGPEFCIYNGVKSGCSDLAYPGLPNSFYLNRGPGPDGIPRFREASEERGVRDPTGRGMGVVFADLDDDGDSDLYVANDGGGNRLFLNDGRGFFRDYTLMSGAGYSESGVGEAGMGADVGDFDGDGRMDIFVTNFARETNALYRNDGRGLFSHSTVASGLAGPSFVPLGWGTQFFDANLDGHLDLFVANGHVYDVCHEINPQDVFAQRNQLFLNDGSGGFRDASDEVGPGLGVHAVSRGATFGDVDDDGDLDIYVANDGQPGNLLQNRLPPGSRHWIRVRLRGSRSGRDALGARVTVEAEGRRMVQEIKTGSSYLSHSSCRSTFGMGSSSGPAVVEVRWPSGGRSRYRSLPADRLYRLPEESAGDGEVMR